MNCTFRTYVREILEDFPAAAFCAYREWGIVGLRIAISAYLLRFAPRPQISPIGKLTLFPELLNFIDNFCANELRCIDVEQHLKVSPAPVVIDIGVSVGVTVRWWLSLSPNLRVVGIDMLSEVLDFTSTRVAESNQLRRRWTPICSAVGNSIGKARLLLNDPFEGTTSLFATAGSQTREVTISTVDFLLNEHDLPAVDLLKIDIEGSAGLALEGARSVLKRTHFVCIEAHNEAETERCADVLISNGFVLFKVASRHMWWKRRAFENRIGRVDLTSNQDSEA